MESSLEFKYIVYLTINIVNGKIYIGVHQTNTPYKFDGYLGCGAWAYKPTTYNKKKTPLHRAILKYGPNKFKRITLKIFNTREEALQLEATLVTKEFIKQPFNYNATVGGGNPPLLATPINQFDLEGNFIKTWESGESIKQYFNSHVSINDIVINKRNFAGFYWSKDLTINIHEFKRTCKYSWINQYDREGTYITTYPSIKIISQTLNISNSRINAAVCRMKLCDGFYFLKSGIKIEDVLVLRHQLENQRTANRHPIYRYLNTGEFDKYYKTTAEAVKDTPKSNGTSLKNAVVKGYLCGGYRWSYLKADNYFNLTNPTQYTKIPAIEQYDLNGNLVKIWENYKDCKKEFPYCLDVCKGKAKSTNGYIFKYQTKDIV